MVIQFTKAALGLIAYLEYQRSVAKYDVERRN